MAVVRVITVVFVGAVLFVNGALGGGESVREYFVALERGADLAAVANEHRQRYGVRTIGMFGSPINGYGAELSPGQLSAVKREPSVEGVVSLQDPEPWYAALLPGVGVVGVVVAGLFWIVYGDKPRRPSRVGFLYDEADDAAGHLRSLVMFLGLAAIWFGAAHGGTLGKQISGGIGVALAVYCLIRWRKWRETQHLARLIQQADKHSKSGSGESSIALAGSEGTISPSAALDVGRERAGDVVHRLSLGEFVTGRRSEKVDPRSETGSADHERSLGESFYDRGELDSALRCFRRELKIRESFHPASEATVQVLRRVGLIHRRQGRLTRGLEYVRSAVAIQEAVDPRSATMADLLVDLGMLVYSRGQFDLAREHLERALELNNAIRRFSTKTADNLHVLAFLPDVWPAKAPRYLQRRLEISEALGPASEVDALRDLVEHCRTVGHLDSASTYFQRALELAEATEASPEQVLASLGSVYRDLGQVERARRYYEQAVLRAAPESSDPEGVVGALIGLAATCQDIGDHDSAREALERALRLSETIDPTAYVRVEVVARFGMLAVAEGNLEEAVQYRQRHRNLVRARKPPLPESGELLRAIGLAYLERRAWRRAWRYLRAAEDSAEVEGGHSAFTAAVLSDLGEIQMRRGNVRDATSYLERAVEVAESLRARAGQGTRAKEELFAGHQRPYQALIACLWERNHPSTRLSGRIRISGDRERALQYSEQSRARALVELLAEREVELSPQSEEQESLLAEELNLKHRLAWAHDRLAEAHRQANTAPQILVSLAAEERELEDSLEHLQRRLRQAFPAYAAIEYPEPLTAEEIQAALDPRTLLLEYDATGNETFVWSVRRERFAMARLAATAETLGELVDASVGAYRHGLELDPSSAPDDAGRARARLSELLLTPVPPEFWVGVERLVVVPDGPLHYLPFELLPEPEEGRALLTDRHPIAYAPSFTALENLRRFWRAADDGAGGAFLGFGDPAFARDGHRAEEAQGAFESQLTRRIRELRPLPYSRLEVERISCALGTGATAYIGQDATEYRVKSECDGYRYVHFATHGLLDDENPLYSGLALAPPRAEERAAQDGLDDMLQVYEMFGLRLSAELVVCSACDTGRGTIREGEGLVGMSRALFFAGARCVILSLWPVPDAATARVMEQLYRELQRGRPVVEALRLAKARERELEYGDPFYWAAFVAVGLGW
jgi:CHAT domain-containing protein/uncharacterized protein HemY